MEIQEILIGDIVVSEFNTRKNLGDGETDSTIEDLANSIARQGLLNPITVYAQSDGRFALVAGQRRLLAYKRLGRTHIHAIVRDGMTADDATATSLIENVHRADMNPRDKATALKVLLGHLGDVQSVSRETGTGIQTIRKYLQLLNLAPELQEQLAAGEVKGTAALADLCQRFRDPEQQKEVYSRIGGMTQDVHREIIR